LSACLTGHRAEKHHVESTHDLTKKIKPRQGVVANTLKLFRNGAVGFIVWLGMMCNDYKLNKCCVPFDKTPITYEAVYYEGIASNKFFCRLAGSENCHSTLWGIAERASSENDSTSVELIEPRTMRGIVGHDF
jgi:hypothetical protein